MQTWKWIYSLCHLQLFSFGFQMSIKGFKNEARTLTQHVHKIKFVKRESFPIIFEHRILKRDLN